MTILIIEDEAITAMAMRETLEIAGHQVLAVARTYDQVQRVLQKQLPDLAIVDVHLDQSTTDGITIAREITTHYPIPIVYLTAHSELQTYQATKDTQPVAYLLKPVEPTELVTQIEAAYERFQTRQSLRSASEPPLLLPVVKGYRKIDPDKILYVMAAGAHANVYMHDQEKPYFTSISLGRLEQYLTTPNFYRLSRSLLINLDYLERLEQHHLYMATHAKPLDISEAKRQELLRHMTVVRTK
jgi:DNA-binding LytR/AlgR family response regulator